MIDLADELRAEIRSTSLRLRSVSDGEASQPGSDGRWSRKEILGHLIDSAANNHQRFVRAQLADTFAGPGYDQDAWVSLQGYKDRSWVELVDIWVTLNTHLAHVVERVPAARLATPCVIGPDAPVTLEWLMRDYVRHLRHHLAQIFGT